jgi:ATP-dependent helicase/nuclease subunit A
MTGIKSWEEAGQRPLSDEQWAAVKAAQAGNVLVSAGAGSGKTHTVIATIVWHLGVSIREESCPSPLQLRDIAAITFTNRAAADLKGKLRAVLNSVGLKKDAYDLDLARIGTIHSFCGEILREFALRAGLSPVRTVLEANEGDALRADAVRDVLLEAAEADDLPGLQELFTEYSVDKIIPWVSQLGGDGDQVTNLMARIAMLGPREAALVTLADRSVRELGKRLDVDRAVDFDRLIVRTRDIVRDNLDVRAVLQRRIKLLIVDEFQDVDPVQQEIARILGEDGSTRLMLVGDAKQSIYRFRRADVTGWKQTEREFAGGRGQTVPLSTNYRSSDGILAFVEAGIGRILDKPLGGAALTDFEIPFSALRPDPERLHQDRTVEAIIIPTNDDGSARKIDECRQLEADAVAARMLELRGNRPWSDFAIVIASWSDMDTYEAALRRNNIPSCSLRLLGFYERREVIDCLLALQVLLDPSDDVAFMGWLRSPFIGVRDETLLRIARDCAQPYAEHAQTCVIPDDEEQRLVTRALDLIARFRSLRDRIATSDLLQELLEESGYIAHLALMGGEGLQPLANIRKFLRELSGMRDSGVAEVLHTIQETRERDVMVGDERLFAERDDVVTITSIHGAKGLEWPIVFWCDLGRSGHFDTDRLKVLRDRIELGDCDREAKDQPLDWQALKGLIEAEGMAESKRLWYVAATRAGERLILSGIPLGKLRVSKSTPAIELTAVFPNLCTPGVKSIPYQGLGQTFTMDVRTASTNVDEAVLPEAPLLEDDSLPPTLPEVVVPRGRGKHSATELMLYERCPRKHWFKYIAGISEPAIATSGRRKDELVSALKKGQIVHDVLENLEEELKLEELLEEAIGRWDPDAPLPDQPRGRAYRELLSRGVEQIATEPTYRSIVNIPNSRRELEFTTISPDGAVTQGAFDLVAQERANGEFVILDVKMGGSGTRSIDERMHGYHLQVETYVTATESITGSEVSRFVFEFGTDTGTEVKEILIDDSKRKAMGADLRAAIAQLPSGNQTLAGDAKTCWSCGYRRVGWCAGLAQPDIASRQDDS